MTREQAEGMITAHLVQIADIMEEYYRPDGYLHMCIDRDEGMMTFNNQDWEHAVGKLHKVLKWEGGEWVEFEFITRDSDLQGEA